MKLTYNEFEFYLSNIYQLNNEADIYVEHLPTDINIAIIDNTHARCILLQLDYSFKLIFGEYWSDVSWFLYDCQFLPIERRIISVNSKEYNVATLDAYLKYAKENFDFVKE